MAFITVQREHDDTFTVTVEEGGSKTVHEVTVTKDHLEEYGGADNAEQLLQASFEFLLDREPKESILRAFNLSLITRYFPEYQKEIRNYLK